MLAGVHPGVLLTVVLDNARSQRWALVQSLAQRLGIALLFLPAYSPNLHLIERFWTFVKKPCLSSKYSPDHGCFQQAIIACIAQAPDKHKEELESLLTLLSRSRQSSAPNGCTGRGQAVGFISSEGFAFVLVGHCYASHVGVPEAPQSTASNWRRNPTMSKPKPYTVNGNTR